MLLLGCESIRKNGNDNGGHKHEAVATNHILNYGSTDIDVESGDIEARVALHNESIAEFYRKIPARVYYDREHVVPFAFTTTPLKAYIAGVIDTLLVYFSVDLIVGLHTNGRILLVPVQLGWTLLTCPLWPVWFMCRVCSLIDWKNRQGEWLQWQVAAILSDAPVSPTWPVRVYISGILEVVMCVIFCFDGSPHSVRPNRALQLAIGWLFGRVVFFWMKGGSSKGPKEGGRKSTEGK